MPEDLYTELAHIQGLELGPALERLDNRRDIYEKSLRILLDNLPGLLARLPAELEAGDIRGFAVDLHGLKGSLYSIGAQAAGNHALELEKHAGDDTAFCAEQLRELTGEVQGLSDALGVCLKERGTAAIFTAPSARVLVVDDMPSNIVVVEGLIAPCQMKVD
ncbi:MAG: Hpt domain-containing protein, partial [Treponema sp.]|nr:Hpt domain-containing protein [Treponema sp.]